MPVPAYFAQFDLLQPQSMEAFATECPMTQEFTISYTSRDRLSIQERHMIYYLSP